MIKIVFTIGTLLTGGAEVFVVNLIKQLNLNKFSPSLIVLDQKNNTFLERELERLGIKVYYMNKKPGFRPLTFLKVYRLLKRLKPNLIHGNIGGIIYVLPYLLLKRNVRAIHTAHTLARNEFGKLKRMVLRYFYLRKKIIPVVISDANYEEFLSTYNLDSKYVRLIYNGIDIEKFYVKRSFQIEEIKLGHVGRFEEVKNHKTIIQIFNELINQGYKVSLRLVGKGSLLDYYKEQLNNKKVYFIEETSKVEEELKQIDFFVFPSIYEGMPLSVIEAMASGCIVLCSNVGGLNDLIIDDMNGYKYNYDDYMEYVRSVRELINDPSKMIEISNNNINKAKEYSLTKMVNNYELLYQEVNDVKWTI